MKQLRENGSTIIELIVVMTIIGIFARIVTFNLYRSHQRAGRTVTRNTLLSDMRLQQMRAISGEVAQEGEHDDYSLYFEEDGYTLFPGSVYESSNPDNRKVTLNSVFMFSDVTFPSDTLTFERISGQVQNYASESDSVTVTNRQTGESFTVWVNAYGVPLYD